MSSQMSINLTYLKLLEASQSAFESSEKALKAAEEAFNSAKRANVDARASLDAATEAFKAASHKTSENEQTSSSWMLTAGRYSEQENNADPDEAEEDFIMLSSKRNPVIDLEDDVSPPFFLITSNGPAADYQSVMLGLYRRSEEIKGGRSVYTQEHDSKYQGHTHKLLSDKGVWRITTWYGAECMRAATPSESPSSLKCQYQDYNKNTWHDDPALTVTGLSEKPSSECEVTISLSRDIVRDIEDPGVVGVYRGNGSYRQGRPVLQHSGGLFTLSADYSCWRVESGVVGGWYLLSGSAPSQCPADPRAARNEKQGLTHWRYYNKQHRMVFESSGISVKCIKCIK